MGSPDLSGKWCKEENKNAFYFSPGQRGQRRLFLFLYLVYGLFYKMNFLFCFGLAGPCRMVLSLGCEAMGYKSQEALSSKGCMVRKCADLWVLVNQTLWGQHQWAIGCQAVSALLLPMAQVCPSD